MTALRTIILLPVVLLAGVVGVVIGAAVGLAVLIVTSLRR